ncbi:MgtC/SapB family protein [Thioalkalivibrio sp. XN8]|uniref:MgtC/SapB family protein n=1 Tax=Thioalkalivibrio sp. XN8 TaxID=2712863 RepID=UPI0013ECC20C|nr:MgtC/SapB family protein [Thioalkalivibrio sp. XN8]NGP53125.1 MgtC/SapB family protein [Thioalkalivibrio sp. XN8]
MNEAQLVFYHLGVALAIGLLIGTERGWQEREAKEGERIAGVRTFGLIGLLGGVLALLAEQFGQLVLGLGFVGLAGAVAAIYVVNLREGNEDVGMTSQVSALLTFAFGALAAMGEAAVAAAAAVVTTLLLSAKPVLHRWVGALEAGELQAVIKLLLISVVLLPILPNQGYGPWQALNPYAIWWMVVLVATISFIGYFAIKIAGARRGTIFTGLFGGLASSTAVTLHFSRVARAGKVPPAMLATGILLACGTMFPRMLLVGSLVNPQLFAQLAWPAVVMGVLTYGGALFYWRASARQDSEGAAPLQNPLELKTALAFGSLLALIMLLSKALRQWFGEAGVLALAAASGVADVDAITLSLARMSSEDLAVPVAVTGIVIAASVNTLVKGGMAAFIGGRPVGLRVAGPLLAAVAGGLTTAWLWVW